jgi:hypothetical protein
MVSPISLTGAWRFKAHCDAILLIVRDERVARAWKHTRGLGSDPSRPVLVNRGIV